MCAYDASRFLASMTTNALSCLKARGTAFRRMLLAGLVVGTALVALSASTTASTINPGYTTTDPLGGRYPEGANESSFGFFFQINQDGYSTNALGFSGQGPNPNISPAFAGWTLPYTVALWRFDELGFYLEAEREFTPNDPNLTLKNNYWWLALDEEVPLQKSTDDTTGYVIGAYGLFNEPDGNFYEFGGTASFSSVISLFPASNGFNVFGFEEYPIPVFDANIVNTGYWNANLSIVPEPAPAPLVLTAIGVVAGCGWRLKRRRGEARDPAA
jgi:hypothetical protein